MGLVNGQVSKDCTTRRSSLPTQSGQDETTVPPPSGDESEAQQQVYLLLTQRPVGFVARADEVRREDDLVVQLAVEQRHVQRISHPDPLPAPSTASLWRWP